MSSLCYFPPLHAHLSPRPSTSSSSRGRLSLYTHRASRVLRSGAAVSSRPSSDGKSRDGRRLASDDVPYVVSEGGRVSYLDELDVVTLLDPPKELIPLDPASYNPAAYLWKKIGDIPEERRHRLLFLLKDRLISRVWQLTETRYLDDTLCKKISSSLLTMGMESNGLEIWNCKTSYGPLPFSWFSNFKKVIFRSGNGGTYGRIIPGSLIPSSVTNNFCTLYFTVRQVNEVMSTEQPCDLAYDFGNGRLDLFGYPEKFPKPVKHPWPFNDQMVIYVRHAGPGVVVGQAWQEGTKLEQVPKKFCGEILMVKAYDAQSMDM